MQRIFLILFSLFIISNETYAKPLHFVLISARKAQDAFWKPVEDFSQQAAEQLGVKLSIVYANSSKQQMLEKLKEAKNLHADAVIFPNIKQVAFHFMEEAEQLQMPVFLFNSGVLFENKLRVGTPRQLFKCWLASSLPDDQRAGYLLGKHLIEQARLKNLSDDKGMVQIIAINGTIADTPAILRLEGLKTAIKEDGNSSLLQSVHAYWSQKTANYKSQYLIKRYPNAKVYWAASDLMAIGVNKALADRGLIQGKDYLTGGVDWSKEGLMAVKQGQISSSIGGHFMEAAWAVILLYDHFHGVDLDEEGSYQLQSPMSLISSKEIDLLLPHLESGNWTEVNFRLRSKVLNKELKSYDFSPESILTEVKKHHDNVKQSDSALQ